MHSSLGTDVEPRHAEDGASDAASTMMDEDRTLDELDEVDQDDEEALLRMARRLKRARARM